MTFEDKRRLMTVLDHALWHSENGDRSTLVEKYLRDWRDRFQAELLAEMQE